MQYTFYRVAAFLPCSQWQNAPSSAAHQPISRHRCTKFLPHVSLTIHPMVYFQYTDNSSSSWHIYKTYSKFLHVLLFKNKNYVQKQSVYWEKKKKGKHHEVVWAGGFINLKVNFFFLFYWDVILCSCKILELSKQQCSDYSEEPTAEIRSSASAVYIERPQYDRCFKER